MRGLSWCPADFLHSNDRFIDPPPPELLQCLSSHRVRSAPDATRGIICVVLFSHACILRTIIMLWILITLQQAVRDYCAAPGHCFTVCLWLNALTLRASIIDHLKVKKFQLDHCYLQKMISLLTYDHVFTDQSWATGHICFDVNFPLFSHISSSFPIRIIMRSISSAIYLPRKHSCYLL